MNKNIKKVLLTVSPCLQFQRWWIALLLFFFFSPGFVGAFLKNTINQTQTLSLTLWDHNLWNRTNVPNVNYFCVMPQMGVHASHGRSFVLWNFLTWHFIPFGWCGMPWMGILTPRTSIHQLKNIALTYFHLNSTITMLIHNNTCKMTIMPLRCIHCVTTIMNSDYAKQHQLTPRHVSNPKSININQWFISHNPKHKYHLLLAKYIT